MKKRLVIDASIAAHAGHAPDPQNPQATACRKILEEIYKFCHRAIITDAIRKEWDDHQRSFFVGWRTMMQSRGKLVPIADESNEEFRNDLSRAANSDRQEREMLKDAHLFEAADKGDRVIIAIDDRSLRYFNDCCDEVRLLQTVMWINPANDKDKTVRWLKSGARQDETWKLNAN